MLKTYTSHSHGPGAGTSAAGTADAHIWLDLLNPSDEERRQAEKMLGTSLPTREQTSAIELSSRLNVSNNTLRVNIPSYVRTEGEHGPSTPLGFILTPTLLATVRYAESLAFDQVAGSLAAKDGARSSTEVFAEIIESIVDVAADRIEGIAGKLSKLAQAVFSEERDRRGLLRTALFEVGAMQRQINQLHSALLGVSRVVTYLCDVSLPWIGKDIHSRFTVAHADIGSLNEFDQQMSERLQFLLDAILGFINNDQNDIMRVLTIVSVATVPPMILAGIWGMNFKNIPEYDWKYGYQFGLSMIVLSMIIPLVIFRIKKWL